MTEATESYENSRSHLLNLPYELRQRIFRLALKQKGTVELQRPIWSESDTFAQPLFQTSNILRDEALEAFYKTNSFLWFIERGLHHRSNPAEYPLHTDASSPLPSAVPWHYPHALLHLRHLHVNIYLPSDRSVLRWSHDFAALLTGLVQALDAGSRLHSFHLLLTTKQYNTRLPLSTSQRTVLDILSQLQIRGEVWMRMRCDFRGVKDSIETLDLKNRMRVA